MDQNAFDTTAGRRNGRRRLMLVVLLGSAVATLGAGAMSLAVFSDTAASTGAWTTGTVVLGVSPVTSFSAGAIVPGDSGSQTLTIANSGTGDLRYAMSSVVTNLDGKGLAAQLQLTIRAGSCAAPGSTLYSGSLSGSALGSNAQGADTGDRDVAAGASDSLCVDWSFPLTSGNAFQTSATDATFTFDAEQTANNP